MAEQTKIFWFDLTTPDPERAKAFYADLFGWTYTEQDRGPSGFYRMVAVGGRDIGGLVSMAEASLRCVRIWESNTAYLGSIDLYEPRM